MPSVVPWTKKSRLESSAPAFANPAITPLAGSDGTVSTFSCRRPCPSSPSSTTSVNVPPTSTAIRTASASPARLPRRGVQLFEREVVDVVAEVARPAELDARVGPPLLVARNAEHDRAEAVAEALGRDRLAGLRIDERDQVRDARDERVVANRHEVLVLEAHGHRAPGEVVEALEDAFAEVPPALDPALRRRRSCRGRARCRRSPRAARRSGPPSPRAPRGSRRRCARPRRACRGRRPRGAARRSSDSPCRSRSRRTRRPAAAPCARSRCCRSR